LLATVDTRCDTHCTSRGTRRIRATTPLAPVPTLGTRGRRSDLRGATFRPPLCTCGAAAITRYAPATTARTRPTSHALRPSTTSLRRSTRSARPTTSGSAIDTHGTRLTTAGDSLIRVVLDDARTVFHIPRPAPQRQPSLRVGDARNGARASLGRGWSARHTSSAQRCFTNANVQNITLASVAECQAKRYTPALVRRGRPASARTLH
jgi:hypothetical protein